MIGEVDEFSKKLLSEDKFILLHFLFVIFKLIIRWKPNSSRISVRIPSGISLTKKQLALPIFTI